MALGPVKAILLFSGGLDSLIAYFILKRAGISIRPVIFKTVFFEGKKAQYIAEKNEIEYEIVDINRDFFNSVFLKPYHGRGKFLNPCFDCHLLMLKRAYRKMQEEGYDLIATGDVVGQRPMSQKKTMLIRIDRIISKDNIILRPLSAKIMPVTVAEEKNWIKRDDMLEITGRGRKKQMELAEEFKIKDYLTPAGGCLLTDEGYCRKAGSIFKYSISSPFYYEIIKYGRFFQIEDSFLVIGRNERENARLNELKSGKALFISPINVKGPDSIIFGNISPENLEQALLKIKRYCDNNGEKIEFLFDHGKE